MIFAKHTKYILMYWWACFTISHWVQILFTGRLTLSHFSLDPWEKNQQCLLNTREKMRMIGWKDWKDFEKPAASLLPHDSKGRSQSDTWKTSIFNDVICDQVFFNGFESHWVSPGSQGCHPGPERIFPGVKDADPSLLRLAVSRRFFPCFLSLHLATFHQHCITAFRRKRLEENDLLLPPSTPATPQNSFFQFPQFPIFFSFCFLSPSHSLGLLLHRLTSWARISEKFDWGWPTRNKRHGAVLLRGITFPLWQFSNTFPTTNHSGYKQARKPRSYDTPKLSVVTLTVTDWKGLKWRLKLS